MKDKPTIVNKARLEEVLQNISNVFVEEKLSPFEIKIALEMILNNIENLDDIYTKARLKQVLSAGLTEERTAMGVS
jgi:hypothetical protein